MPRSRPASQPGKDPGTQGDDFFEYQPLDQAANEIRLLRLLPDSDPSASVHCELHHVPLTVDTSYEALSYCWGSSATPKHILLNEHRFAVTDSLHSALLILRKPDEARILWIDAICMNQKDDDEKGREVWRMLEIYSCATRVVVWLGESSGDSDLAITHLAELATDWTKGPSMSDYLQLGFDIVTPLVGCVGFIASALSRTYRKRRENAISFHIVLYWLVSGYPDRSWWELIAFFCLTINLACRTIKELFAIALEHSKRQPSPPRAQDVRVLAVRNFFSRPWFNRTWTIQEIVAALKATVICGMREIPLESLHAACDRILDLINGAAESSYLDSNFQRFALLSDVVKHGHHPTQYHRRLLYMLNAFSHREASDPRDKVYGLLGLSEEAASNLGAFPVNYKKNVVEVYKDTARYLIETGGTLDVLRARLGTGKVDGLPSWVPDWTTTQGRSAHGLSHFREPLTIGTLEGDTNTVVEFCSNNAVLNVRGFLVGTLSDQFDFEISSVSSPNAPENSPLVSIISALWPLVQAFLRFIGKLHTVVTLLSPLPGLAYYYHGVLRFGVHGTLNDNRFMNPVPQSTQGFAAFHSPDGDAPPPTVKAFTVLEATGLRRDRIGIFGTCSTLAHEARAGDLLCFFIGVKTPFIIRSIDKHYIYVGPATAGGSYADGILCDAIKQAYKAGAIETVAFTLH